MAAASMRWLVLLAMAFVLAAAGCGGGGEESAASEEAAIEEAIEETTEETSPDSGTGTDAGGDFCGTLLTARVFISAAFVDPGSVSQEGLDELADKAPAEIRADIRTIAQALATLDEKVGEDPDVFELNAALASLPPEREAAEKRLDAWQMKNCTGEKSADSEETRAEEKLKTPQDRTWDAWTDVERGLYCGNLLFIRIQMSAASTGENQFSTSFRQGDIDQMTSNPPEEIRADVKTIAQALAAYTKEVADDPTVLAAGKRLDAWAEKNC